MRVCNVPQSQWDMHMHKASWDSCSSFCWDFFFFFPLIKAVSWNITLVFCQSRDQRWPRLFYSKLLEHLFFFLMFICFLNCEMKLQLFGLKFSSYLRRRTLISIAALNYFPISFLLKLLKYQGITVTHYSEALASDVQDGDMSSGCLSLPGTEQDVGLEGGSAQQQEMLLPCASLLSKNGKKIKKSLNRESKGENLLFSCENQQNFFRQF